MTINRVTRAARQHAYDCSIQPAMVVQSGSVVVFETIDAANGALLREPFGVSYELPSEDEPGNPVSGPVAVDGAEVGDCIAVKILEIECGPAGWCAATADAHPLPPGRLKTSVARSCALRDGYVEFSNDLRIVARPMIGCLGVAPDGDGISTALAGRHGGNMDQPVVTTGATILLPVLVPGALLSLGDVHAVQGDGELSGTGLEVPAEVTVCVELRKGRSPTWPWLLGQDHVAILTSGQTVEESLSLGLDSLVTILEESRGYDPGTALSLISLVANARIGAAWGGPMVTTRIEIPRAYLAVPFDDRAAVG